ncbi:MAG: hypothetical protein V1779_05995 [bacterium]
MKSKNNKLITLLAVLAILAIPMESIFGQHLQNLTGGKIKNAGVIRLIDNNGELQNELAADAAMGVGYDGEFTTPSGTIEFAGSTNLFAGTAPFAQGNDTRINGWVVYTSASGQTLDPDTWYTNLGLRLAGAKDFGAGTYNIDHVYTSDRAGNRNYNTSTVIYDGGIDETGAPVAAGVEDQDVFAENGAAAATNAYYNLYFDNDGIKTLQTDAVYWQNNAVNEISLDNGAVYVVEGTQVALGGCTVTTTNTVGGTTAKPSAIDVDGTGGVAGQDGWFRTNTGVGTIAGDVFIHSGGTYITDDVGLQTYSGNVTVGDDYTGGITNTSGSLTLDAGDMTFADGSTLTLTNVAGHIVNGPARLLLFEGAADFENTVGWDATTARANMEFDVTSTTEYAGTDDIESTGENYPYGNLTVSSAAQENIETSTMVFVAGNFSLTGNDLWADQPQDPSDGSSEVLVMLDENATMTYGVDMEVVGAVRRYTGGSSATMTFNNTATQSAISDVPAEVTWLQYAIWKGEAPNENGTGNAMDVDRRTLFNVDAAAAAGTSTWKAYLRLGYLTGECGAATPDYYNSLRFRTYTPNAGADDKITTGIVVNRHIAFDVNSNFAWAELYGFTTGELDGDLKETVPDGNEIFLRGGPTWFITINNGRWSNPNTWDEGIQPGPNDLCLVRHTVWAGFVNNIDGYAINESVHLATFTTDVSNLTSYIQIYNAAAAAPAPAYHGALVFGEKAAADGAGSHETDPAWGLREDGQGNYGGAWDNTEGLPGLSITQGTIEATPIVDGGAVDVTDADILLQHYDAAVATLYNGGLYVHGQTQLTVPTLLTSAAMLMNAGTIIVGQ